MQLGCLSIALLAASAHAAPCPDVDAGALTLPAAAARALCLDPSLAQREAELARLQGVLDEAGAARAWKLEAQVGPSASAQQGSGRDTHSASLAGALIASRTLADGGATRARTAQRERELAAGRADLAATRQDSLRSFVSTWADAREAQAALAAATLTLDAARASDAAVRARLAAGSATRVDALSAASTLAAAEADVLAAQTGLRARLGVLSERLGGSPLREGTLRGDDEGSVAKLGARLTDATPQSSLDMHPQVAAQRERLRSRRDAIDAARADEGAQWSVSGRTGPNLTRGNSATLSGSETTKRWTSEAAVTWTLPLSDGGSRRARVSQAEASLDGERADAAALERSLRENLWQQWNTWRSAAAERSAAQAAFAAAHATEAAQRGRYQAGAGTLTDWIQAQSELGARARRAAAAEQQLLRSAAGAAHALGRLDLPTLTP